MAATAAPAPAVPAYVFGTVSLSAAMVACSFAVMALNVNPAMLVYQDCLATQNLGHAAFLLAFATSAWRGGNLMAACFIYAAPRLLLAHAIAAAVVVLRTPMALEAEVAGLVGALLLGALAACSTTDAPSRRRKVVADAAAEAARLAAYIIGVVYCATVLVVAALGPPPPAFGASWAVDFVQGYTLAFHVAFVLSLGLACAASVEGGDGAAAADYGAAFVSGAVMTAVTLIVSWAATQKRGFGALASLWLGTAVLVGGSLARRAADDAADKPISRHRRCNSLASLARGGVRGAFFAQCCAAVHGATFLGQALLVIFTETSPLAFDKGANFAIHGAGIYVYNSLLIFVDQDAYPRLKRVSVFACFAGALSSFGVAARADSFAVRAVFAARVFAGVALGCALAYLPDKLPDDDTAEDRVETREALVSDAPQEYIFEVSAVVKHQKSHFLPWWLACSACFATFAYLAALEEGGNDSMDLSVVETPSTYLLGFHFLFLLTTFSAHGLATDFEPSLCIALSFLLASAVVAAAQCVFLLASTTLTASTAAFCASLALCAVTGLRLWNLLGAPLRSHRAHADLVQGDGGNLWR
ncbi:hypothetical protein M885DRAFT_611450 [Pelagophyceae sp. CCMP2097]|nr:hypothetical protein M885DRAFT_611450 [Pelagophyceae sp. CCMP2097]